MHHNSDFSGEVLIKSTSNDGALQEWTLPGEIIEAIRQDAVEEYLEAEKHCAAFEILDEFSGIARQLVALGAFEEYAGLWNEALQAALSQITSPER